MVTRLETGASGRTISAVTVERNGATEKYSADVVVVSAGAINSAALLLRSANEKHPNGLANSSDQVGRNYMGHINSVVLAVSKCPNPTVFQKTLAVNDFYFGTDEFPFPMGHISFVGKLDGVTLSRRCARNRARIYSGINGKTFARFLADDRRFAAPRKPRNFE